MPRDDIFTVDDVPFRARKVQREDPFRKAAVAIHRRGRGTRREVNGSVGTKSAESASTSLEDFMSCVELISLNPSNDDGDRFSDPSGLRVADSR